MRADIINGAIIPIDLKKSDLAIANLYYFATSSSDFTFRGNFDPFTHGPLLRYSLLIDPVWIF